MEGSDGKKRQIEVIQDSEIDLGRRIYLDSIIDSDQRRLVTALRSGTNTLRIETERWIGEKEEERTCVICGQGDVENEQHALFVCSGYERRREFVRKVADRTGYDLNRMWKDKQWLVEMGVGSWLSGKREKKRSPDVSR